MLKNKEERKVKRSMQRTQDHIKELEEEAEYIDF